MITHIVLWKLHDRKNLASMRKELESLPERVPGIVKLAVGIPPTPEGPMAHISLYTEFHAWDDLRAYQQHPEHLKVVEIIKPLVSERAVSDYETP